MPRFKISDLPENALNMHKTQGKWRNRNWNNSLKNHSNELEDLLSLIELFSFWMTRLPTGDATSSLSKEIYTDAYFSIHLACFGLYKNAYMCLRSQFETAMRLIYFSSHPFEYKLWLSEDEKWKKDLLSGSDVWGQGFKYFAYMPKIKELESLTPNTWLLKGNNPKLRTIYSKLSRHVHSSGPSYLQTRHGRLSPEYKEDEFIEWQGIFKDVQKYINILFALCFPNEFENMPSNKRNEILDIAIGTDYKDLVNRVLGL